MCWNETDRKSGGKEKVDEKVDLERMTQSGVSMRNPGGVPCSKGSPLSGIGPLSLAVWSLPSRLETSYPTVADGRLYYCIHVTLFPLFITRTQRSQTLWQTWWELTASLSSRVVGRVGSWSWGPGMTFVHPEKDVGQCLILGLLVGSGDTGASPCLVCDNRVR